MTVTGAMLASATWVASTQAQTPAEVQAPLFKPGDSWLFDETVERGSSGFMEKHYDLKIERLNSDSMVVGIKPEGSPVNYQDHIDGLDWSLRRLVEGREVTTAQPYAFPMSVGKTWTADYTDPDRHGLQSSAHYHWSYKVTGWEDVTVPAGTFHAIRVEATGVVAAQMDAASGVVGGAMASGASDMAVVQRQKSPAHTEYFSLHSTFDYAPQVKAAAKTVEEVYDSQETRIRLTTRTLAAFRPAP